MELYKKFQNLSRGRQIGCVVLLIHFLCVFALTVHHLIANHPPKRPIAVRTRQIALPQKAAVANTNTTPKKQTPSPPKAAKKTAAKAPSKKVEPAKKAVKETPKAEPEPIVEEIVTTTFTKTALSLPSLIETPTTSENLTIDPTYEELLIATFQSTLDLPEMGEVKARLEIDRTGRLVSCTILETKSRKNEEFLKNRLPDLMFPCFNGGDIQSFTVTFRNVENR